MCVCVAGRGGGGEGRGDGKPSGHTFGFCSVMSLSCRKDVGAAGRDKLPRWGRQWRIQQLHACCNEPDDSLTGRVMLQQPAQSSKKANNEEAPQPVFV